MEPTPEPRDLAEELEIPLHIAQLILYGARRRGFDDPLAYLEFVMDYHDSLLDEKQRNRLTYLS
jgi:hypothetical protein